MKDTLIIGASEKTERYSNRAVKMLRSHNIPVTAIGIREGQIDDVKIITTKPNLKDIHSVSLYINPQLQKKYYDYILSLKPKRVIFNPGTENPELLEKVKNEGIDPIEACTLVMLSTGSY